MRDQDFLSLAQAWAPRLPSLDGVIRPAQVQRLTRDLYDDWLRAYNEQIARAHSFWPTVLAALALLTVAGIAIWPRRSLSSDLVNLAGEGVLVDLNQREHERISMIGTLSVTNDHPWALWKAPFRRLGIAINERSLNRISEGAITDEPLPFDYEAALQPLAITTPDQSELHDRNVPSGKQYPILLATRAIADLQQTADGPEPVEIKVPVLVDVTFGRPQNPKQLIFPLLVRPQIGRLAIRSRGVERGGERARVAVEFVKGERAQPLCIYNLRTSATKRFSTPVSGRVRVLLRTLDKEAADYLVYLLDEENNPTLERGYRLTFGAPELSMLSIPVVADFTRLANPRSEDQYTVIVEVQEATDAAGNPIPPESRVWEQRDAWRLCVLRSTKRTDVSMQAVLSDRERSPALNKDQPELQDYAIGSRDRPRPLRRQPRDQQNRMTLCQIRLANACRDGHGYAHWQASLTLKATDGLNVRPEALRLVDERGEALAHGQLLDSHEDRERIRLLDVELNLKKKMIEIIERHASLRLELTVDWRIHEDGKLSPGNVQPLRTRMDITCHLRHEPPADTLAVDFGTSALAVAHASGSGEENRRLLALQTRLAVIAKERGLLPRYDDTGKASPFLSSECNVELNPEVRKTLRPSDAGFLQLPLHTEAIARHPDLVFSSLKAMMSAGLDDLPLNAESYPYLNEQGELETGEPPQLTEVILGAYRGLLQDYIDPLLLEEHRDFSHVYITHPNTYTANHVADLRTIMNRLLAGRVERSINRIYPENIHFFSESDAVAFYYLYQAHELRGGARQIPPQERILVYDIGAGTLDMTHLVVEWKDLGPDAKTPKRVRVLHRDGVTLAGDRLDECIARDIHAQIEQRLDRERYINPIVETVSSGAMEGKTRELMDNLRMQIHQLKIALSEGQREFKIELARTNLTQSFVQTRADETVDLYKDVADMEGDSFGRVTLTLTREQILDGANVQAFITEVTRHQIERFFRDRPAPELDTVLLSGRTSLWPGFLDRLKDSLPYAQQWIDFSQDAKTLKQVVVLGVLQRAFRWEDIEFEEPDVIGDFGVYWQEAPPHWTFTPWERSGDEKPFCFVNSPEFKIGRQTAIGHTWYFERFSREFYDASDKILYIRLDFDKAGYCRAEVRNSVGDPPVRLHEKLRVATLTYSERPWPLGKAKLQQKEPADVVKA